jgi:hypothetical protein
MQSSARAESAVRSANIRWGIETFASQTTLLVSPTRCAHIRVEQETRIAEIRWLGWGT